MTEIVRLEQVRHVYPDGTTVHFAGLPVTVNAGERVLLLGANGAGKTTLLFHVLGLLAPSSGTVRVFGHDPVREFEQVRRGLGALLQNPDDQIIAPTVRDDIAFSPRNYGKSAAEVEALVASAADELEISHLLDKVPHYLSGGERLKVALAGALAVEPRLLVLDEPFEGLDTGSKQELVELINRQSTRGVGVLISTHEINLVPACSDTVYLLARGGAIVRRGTPRELLTQPDLLASHHVEPPVLSRVFERLRARGLDLPTGLTAEEAVEILLDALAPLPGGASRTREGP